MIQTMEVSVSYTGDGVQTSFPYPYDYRSGEDITGYLVDAEGRETEITTNYKFDTVENNYIYPLNGDPIQAPTGIKITRETPLQNNVDLPDRLPFSIIEKMFDWIIMMLQETVQQANLGTYNVQITTEQANIATLAAKNAQNYALDAAASANSASVNATVAQRAADTAQDKVNEIQGVLEDVQEAAKNVNVFIPDMDMDGNLSWSNKMGLENPEPVNLIGPQGATGPQGPQGIQGPKGDKGDKGDTGESGVQIETNVFCVFSVRNGHLICTYQDGQEQPNFSINDAGHLIYTINE